MRRPIASSLSVFAGLLLVSGVAAADTRAQAEQPRGTYVMVPQAPGTAETHSSNIIVLNPCWGGCTLTRGNTDDSRSMRSSIIDTASVSLSQFNAGQSTWNAVVSCVRDMYAPFNIVVTDQPTTENHFMAIVAGRPSEAGFPRGVGGVSPFSCGVINNAITYSFANLYGGSVQSICEVVAQETAHAFGLDHEFHCPDPMTYLSGCGAKEFRDVDAQCGEGSARQCQCGGSTQNSVQKIMAVFGPSEPTPPNVAITTPSADTQVEKGFVVRADISDDDGVVKAELVINGQVRQTLTQAPYAFNAPNDLSDGVQVVEVRGTDSYGAVGSDTVNVVIGAPCDNASDCSDGETCIEGRCVAGPGSDGGLGEACEGASSCASGQCASAGEDRFCVESCESSCPSGFSCVSAGGDTNVCWPGGDGGGGGCSTQGGSGGGLPATFALLLGLLFARRMRRA